MTSYVVFQDNSFGPYTPSASENEIKKILPTIKDFQLSYSPYELQVQYENSKITFTPNELIRPCNNCRLKINKAIADTQNNVWLATDEGIIKLTPKKKQFEILERGKNIERIFQWEDHLWMGGLTENKRIHLLDQTSHSFLKKERVKASAFVTDNNNQLWVAADKNLHVYTQDGKKLKSIALEGEAAKTIHYDATNHQVFTATSIGLEQYNVAADSFRILQISSEETEIRQIYQNDKGLWLITSNGLSLHHLSTLDTLVNYSTADGFPSNNLNYLHEEEEGIFWIGTANNGLFKWRVGTDSIQQYTTADGLTDNTIYAIYEDTYNNLWLPNKSGLNCLTKSNNRIKAFNTNDQLTFHPTAHYQTTTGYIYLGGDNGIIKFHPKDFFKQDTSKSPFHLTKIQVLQNDSDQFEDRTALALSNNKITISPNDKVVEIGFNLLDFRNLNSREYAYRLDGNQDQWIETKENKVNFINLPYGNYTLQIKAKGASNNWSKEFIEIPIEVITPISERWWFRLLLLSIGGVLVYLGSLWRIKALEREKENLEAEVQKRTEQIEKDKEIILQQTEKLKELDKVKTRFFSNITHEFRTPLTLIIGPTQQIINDRPKAAHQQRLKGILGNAKHLLGLINQLLDLSKIESGQMNIDVFRGDIIGYTQEILDRFQPLAKKKKISLKDKSTRKEWKTYFDKDKWDKILINLLSNAIKFTPDKGTIHIQIKQSKREEDYYIFLEVKDSGVGISEDQLDKVFDRFFQVDGSSTRIQQGTGIGLSLVKELVEIQGGTLEVTSEVNKGTTFQIFVPILTADQNAPQKEQKSDLPIIEPRYFPEASNNPEIIASSKPEKGERLELLIIEDNAEMRTYIKQCLDISKYRISEAADGAEGIKKAIANIPDLIISDVMMPRKDGFEVTQTLRETINTSHIPIILLTAKASLASRLEGLKRGADAYLSKPFSPEELTIRVNKLIELRHLLRARYASNNLESTTSTKADDPFTKEDEFFLSVKAIIHNNLTEAQLNGELIGKELNMSRMQLHRKMKALTTTPVSEMIRNIRLNKAVELLKAQNLNISQVAYETGFNSPSHFSRIFKSKYGVSPSEFKSNPVSL